MRKVTLPKDTNMIFSSICRTSSIFRRSSVCFAPKWNNSTLAKSVEESKPWRITAAVTVERLPLITPQLSPLEEKVKNLFDVMEYENSKMNDHEVRHEEDQ